MSNFVSGFQNVISFVLRHLEIPNIKFQKSDVITLTCFLILGHCTAKNKVIGLEFCTPVDGAKFYILHSGFWDIFKNFDIVGIYFWKIEIFNFRGKNPENQR